MCIEPYGTCRVNCRLNAFFEFILRLCAMHCADKLSTYEHKLGLLVALKLVLFGMLKLAKRRLKLTLEYLINQGLLTMTYCVCR